MRRYLIVIITFLMLLTTATFTQAAPKVILNGQPLTFQDTVPTIENGRTLVPLRTIFESLGALVQWDGNTQTVTATKGNTEIKLVIGGQAYKNGQSVPLDVPAKIIDGRTMVPLRFVSEALGCKVGWGGETQTVTIISSGTGATGDVIEVHFIDVGQADAIFISIPGNNDILIDGGNEADGQTVVNYLKGRSVDDIELLIATHPHEDHIGGLPAILDAFKVERIIDSGASARSDIYSEYSDRKVAERAQYEPDNHQTITFGNTALQILTGPETWQDTNDYSVVCRLDTGEIEFLFTGDAEVPVEATLTGQLDAEILKVGHHGSQTSTSAVFLYKVKPEVAIISVGAGNRYGHPSAETIQRIEDAGIEVYRTDVNGDIMVFVDGNTYSVAASRRGPVEISVPQIPPQTQPQVQPIPAPAEEPKVEGQYVASVKSDKYHYPTCRYAEKIEPENLVWFKDSAAARSAGYSPCGICKP